MRFGHVQPLDYNFSYDNVLMLEHFRRALYIISFHNSICICLMKTREPRQNGGKNGRQNTRFWLSPGAYTGSCGSFNDGDVCHISLEA